MKESPDVYSVPVAWQRGTTTVYGERLESEFASSVSRPRQDAASKLASGLIMGVPCAGYLAYRLLQDAPPSLASLFSRFGGIFAGATVLWSLFLVWRGLATRSAERRALAQWEKQWVCGRCGKVWTPDS